MDAIRATLDDFAVALRHRFELGIHTTEDAVRYTFFACLLSRLRCGPERLILEYPHPSRSGALVDAWITAVDGEPEVAIEFKFHRRPPAARNRPRTMLAGAVLGDIFKLASISTPGVRRVFVYVYGQEMHGYYSNLRNGMAGFIDLPAPEMLLTDRFFEGKASTFLTHAGAAHPCRLRKLASENIYRQFRLRAYEIFRDPA